MASSVPAARGNLYDGLTALTATGQPLEGVGVYRTGLWKDNRAVDRIMILNARNVEREIRALAPTTPFRETYTLTVSVEVYRRGDNLEFVEDRLWAIITEIEQYVLANKTLGGAVNQALPATADEQSGPSADDEDTLVAMATLGIDCRAHVFLT